MTPSARLASPSLDQLLVVFGLAQRELQVLDPAHRHFDATRPLVVLPPQFEGARALIDDRYPREHRARLLTVAGVVEATTVELASEAQAWLIEALAPEEDVRSPNGLRAIMERLCAPDGCPWDREQTHESLRRYVIEEAYELVDAIDRGDLDGLREELGDVLMHVVMHAALAQERGEFTFEQVVEGITRKMVRRHPHIFGDEEAGSTEQLWERWDQIKAAERAEAAAAGETAEAGALDSVPKAAPALQRAQSLQRRAVRAGAIEPSDRALDELATAVARLGDIAPPDVAEVLWAAVRLANAHDIDAEEALRERAHGFTGAFADLERRAREEGVEVSQLPQKDRRAPWQAQ